jgi:hypothetical protein
MRSCHFCYRIFRTETAGLIATALLHVQLAIKFLLFLKGSLFFESGITVEDIFNDVGFLGNFILTIAVRDKLVKEGFL